MMEGTTDWEFSSLSHIKLSLSGQWDVLVCPPCSCRWPLVTHINRHICTNRTRLAQFQRVFTDGILKTTEMPWCQDPYFGLRISDVYSPSWGDGNRLAFKWYLQCDGKCEICKLVERFCYTIKTTEDIFKSAITMIFTLHWQRNQVKTDGDKSQTSQDELHMQQSTLPFKGMGLVIFLMFFK